jgi:SAM-dependent methyltransferase
MNRSLFAALVFWLAAPGSLHSNLAACQDRDDKPAPKQKNGPRVYKGRVIAPVMTAAGGGAEWLERSDRDATEQPEKVIDALNIVPGSVVADVGAGTGYFSLRIAKRLGPDGKVLATDVQPEMLRQLSEAMKKAGVKNIERLLATANDSKLPANKVDLALMVDVYHELQDPERMMAQIRKSLKDEGRLVLVEYRAEDPDVPIRPEHKTTLRQIRYEIEPMGFRLKDVFEFLPHQHVEVFVKDPIQGEDAVVDSKDFPTIRRPGWSGVADSEPYERAGFQALFNGKDLDGWTGSTVWHTRGGSIVATAGVSNADGLELKSNESFGDFELDLQWAVKDPNGRAGVWVGSKRRLLIALDAGVPWVSGYPVTIATRRTCEVTTEVNGKPLLATNDMANALVIPNEWNRLTVRCAGGRCEIAINGVKTSEFDAEPGQLAGPIGLQATKGEVEFRAIWLRRLPAPNP